MIISNNMSYLSRSRATKPPCEPLAQIRLRSLLGGKRHTAETQWDREGSDETAHSPDILLNMLLNDDGGISWCAANNNYAHKNAYTFTHISPTSRENLLNNMRLGDNQISLCTRTFWRAILLSTWSLYGPKDVIEKTLIACWFHLHKSGRRTRKTGYLATRLTLFNWSVSQKILLMACTASEGTE